MYKYYVVEIQELTPGQFAYLMHEVSDEDPVQAMKKADSAYFNVLSYAAVSNLPSHSAIMFSAYGVPVENRNACYRNTVTPEPEGPVTE